MRILKCSLLLVWLIAFSSSALAASASAYMNNFSLEVSGGSITQRDNSFVNTDVSVIGDRQQNYSYTPNADFSFDSSTSLANATDIANAAVSFGPNNPNSYLSADVVGQDQHFTFAQSTLFYTYDYKANTTVTVSADAFINFQPDLGSDYLASTWGQIYLSDLLNPNDYSSRSLFIEENTTEPTSRFERISTTFVAPIDTILNINYRVTARINDAPITVVPEPETYAMMLTGLILIGLIARRSQSS